MSMDIERPSRKREIRRRRIIYSVLGIALLIAVTAAIAKLEPAPPTVERDALWIETVERGEFLRSVGGPGTLVPEEIRLIEAESAGQVEAVKVDAGARVTADTVILVLSNPEIEQAARDAQLKLRGVEAEYLDLQVRLDSQVLDQEANFARVKAEYEGALLQAEADQELSRNGLIPEITLRQSELAAEQHTTRHQIETKRLSKLAESRLAQLAVKQSAVSQQRALQRLRQAQFDALEVRATIDGVLQVVAVEAGQRVTPGTNLARVAQPERLKAEVRINETQAKDVSIGQRASIDTRNGIVDGRVQRIDPSVQQGSVIVDLEIVGELPKGARPDLSIDGTIELDRLDDALHLGRPHFAQPNSMNQLFRIDDDGEFAQLVQVQLGRSSVGRIEVISGLEEGDEVIVSDTKAFDQATRLRVRP